MKIAAAYHRLTQQLDPIYDDREARNIARIVFEDALGIRNLNQSGTLPQAQLNKLKLLSERLSAGEPLQYVLGQADFYGLKLSVTPDTLIPRAETEELVYEILQNHSAKWNLSVLDIGTGTGCIPLVLKHKRPNWDLTGVDVSKAALEVAQKNAGGLKLKINYRVADILDEQNWAAFPNYDIVVSNPPYIPPSESKLMPAHVLRHEPHRALFTATEDALVFYRAITRFASQHLIPGGFLYFELNEFNGAEALKYVENQGFKEAVLKNDMNGKTRMLRAVAPINT